MVVDLHLNANVPRRDAADNHGKYAAMYARRLGQGRGHQPAFFGLRSFPAELIAVTGEERLVPVDIDWGWMRGDWGEGSVAAHLQGGVVRWGIRSGG